MACAQDGATCVLVAQPRFVRHLVHGLEEEATQPIQPPQFAQSRRRRTSWKATGVALWARQLVASRLRDQRTRWALLRVGPRRSHRHERRGERNVLRRARETDLDVRVQGEGEGASADARDGWARVRPRTRSSHPASDSSPSRKRPPEPGPTGAPPSCHIPCVAWARIARGDRDRASCRTPCPQRISNSASVNAGAQQDQRNRSCPSSGRHTKAASSDTERSAAQVDNSTFLRTTARPL